VSDSSASDLYPARTDRRAIPALAGFLCALVSFVASLAASVFAGSQTPVGNTPVLWRLGPILQRLHEVFVPGTTSGEAMLQFTAAFPLALVSLIVSLVGCRSSSQRRPGWLPRHTGRPGTSARQ
jgi:hypothetical protein